MPTVSLYPSQATYLRSGSYAYDNYGSRDYLRAGLGSNQTDGGYRTLIQFDLSSIPAGSVTSATLYLYSYSNGCYQAGSTLSVKAIDRSWSYLQATFNSMALAYVNDYATVGPRQGGYEVWYSYNMTSMVQAMNNGTLSNYGFIIYQDDSTIELSKCFYKTTTHPAYLSVTYTGANRNLSVTAGSYIQSVSGGGTIQAYESATVTAVVGSYTGYQTTFSKWIRNSDGATISTSNPYTFTMPDYDYAITAVATRTPYNYVVNLVNGSPSYISQISKSPSLTSYPFSSSVSVSCTLSSLTGYTTTFALWSSSNTTLLPSSANQNYTFNVPAGDITLTATANRVAHTYSVVFSANGGTGTMSNQSFTYDVAKQLTSNAFLRTGYSFTGWATSPAGSVVYTNAQNVSNLSSTNGALVNLYAVWVINEYTVTVQPNNSNYGTASRVGSGVLNYQSAVNITCEETVLSGYTTVFVNWTSNTGGSFGNASLKSTTFYMPAFNTTLTANFLRTANSYTVTFDYGVGSGVTPQKSVTFASTYGVLPIGVKTGYTFLGWASAEQSDYTATSVPSEILVNSDKVVSTASNHTVYAWFHEDRRIWTYDEPTQSATSRCRYSKTSLDEGTWLFSGNYDEQSQTYVIL